jgi:hypothetical protein
MLIGWLRQARWSVLGPQPAGKPTDNSGQQRSPTAHGNCSSPTLQAPDLEGRSRARRSSSLPIRLPQALRALANQTVGHKDIPHLGPEGR